ncbi:MAG: S8/S53 family peptidase [Actinomycetota bacterium]|nr:S8/S53 family peptidase [Actinomycetota bacterium]
MRNRLLSLWSLIAAIAAVAVLAATLTSTSAGSSPDDETAAEDTPAGPDPATDPEPLTASDLDPPAEPPSPDQVRFATDAALRPVVATVEPLDGAGEPRPVARIRSTGGTESDIVLDELIVSFDDPTPLDEFLERTGATLLSSDEPDDDTGMTDHLVRIDRARSDRDGLAADLLAVEPHHDGELAVSDDAVFDLLAVASAEAAGHGVPVSLNWLSARADIHDGEITEDPSRGDPFGWSWISSDRPQQAGIDAAWQLLAGRKGFGHHVGILIVDGGFYPNADFPADAKMRRGAWRDGHRYDDHGTQVTMAAMGRVDNDFGTAGPAGPVADLVAMPVAGGIFELYRNIRKVVRDERPGVVNMSFGAEITVFQDLTEWRLNRQMRKVRDDYGALAFASAGNDGRNVDGNDALTAPCELTAVKCVGGMDGDAARHDSSNYGTGTGGGSVEIYGPYCTLGLANPTVPGDGTTKTVCGTSFASPVVAGIAALVRSAAPHLGPGDVWAILRDTARDTDLGAEVTGHRRRVDAYGAVAAALGVGYEEPTVVIDAPAPDFTVAQEDFFDLEATATSFAGLALPVSWTMDGDPINANPTTDPVTVGTLAPGRHRFEARATDVRGGSGVAVVEVVVENVAPDVSISSPAGNTYRYDVEQVLLSGASSDADDLWQALPEANVAWTVRRLSDGAVVFEAGGYEGMIPAGHLAPGDYEVRFVGTDDGAMTGSDSSLLTILDVPPGESLPSVQVHSPAFGESHGIESGNEAALTLHASATDPEDGVIAGNRFRWVAEQGDTRVVLCEGSALAEGGGLLAPGSGDCSNVDVMLGIPPEAPVNSTWTITVEVYDSADLPARASRPVTVQAVVG